MRTSLILAVLAMANDTTAVRLESQLGMFDMGAIMGAVNAGT